MADYPSQRVDFLDDQLSGGVGRLTIDGYFGGTAQWQQEEGRKIIEALAWDSPVAGEYAVNANKAAPPRRDFGSRLVPTGPEEDWFDHVFVLPSSINAGIILAPVEFTVVVYNSYKSQQRTLDTFVNNAGAGVSLTDLPGLPITLEEQDGRTFTLQVLAEGPAFINDTLDFGFDTRTLSVLLTGQRTIVFPHEPEKPLTETLVFATDILRNRDGTEQRMALRHVPRSQWEMDFLVQGKERRRLETNLIDSQARIFGVPAWYEPSILQSAVAVDDTTVTVDSTDYSSLKAGGLAITFRDFDNFEVLTIDSLTSTTITFQSAYTKPFVAGTRILPVRLGLLRARSHRGQRPPINFQGLKLVFTSTDNEDDLSDTSAWNTYNSKVLLDGPNLIDGSLSEAYNRSIFVFDNQSGKFEVFSEWPISRRGSAKTFFTNTRQGLWEVRQLLHALRGRQVSFYLPTFAEDLIPTAGIGSGGTTLTVENVGYTTFIDATQPRNVVRVTKTDGTTVVREVTSASEIDDDEEQLTVDSPWGIDASVSEIERIDFVEKVRWDSDEITITHLDALGQARINGAVIAVLD